MVHIKITDEILYHNKIINVDTCHLTKYRGYFEGTLSIEVESSSDVSFGGVTKEFYGEHDQDDYKEKYGFILIEK